MERLALRKGIPVFAVKTSFLLLAMSCFCHEVNGCTSKDLGDSRASIRLYCKLCDPMLGELSRFGNVHEQEIVISQKWIYLVAFYLCALFLINKILYSQCSLTCSIHYEIQHTIAYTSESNFDT